ncbi:MAG: hypothetical protein RSB66_08570, partial [Clostridium sp.]
IELHGDYILNTLDLISTGIKGEDSFIDKDLFLSNSGSLSVDNIKYDLLLEIDELKLMGSKLSNNINEAISIIEGEIKNGKYKSVTLEGMLMYIEKEENLHNNITRIREIISRM